MKKKLSEVYDGRRFRYTGDEWSIISNTPNKPISDSRGNFYCKNWSRGMSTHIPADTEVELVTDSTQVDIVDVMINGTDLQGNDMGIPQDIQDSLYKYEGIGNYNVRDIRAEQEKMWNRVTENKMYSDIEELCIELHRKYPPEIANELVMEAMDAWKKMRPSVADTDSKIDVYETLEQIRAAMSYLNIQCDLMMPIDKGTIHHQECEFARKIALLITEKLERTITAGAYIQQDGKI